jgi:hypothetical protein
MIRGTRRTLTRAGGFAGLAGTLTLAGALLTAQTAAAAGNTNFEGILAAASPTGFLISPASYDISGGPVTVEFDVVVRNLTGAPHTVALNFSADHILTDNGQNVSDGQPGQAGIAFSGPDGTTQVVVPGTQSWNQEWDASATDTLSLAYTFDSCGYFQMDVWAPWKGGENDRSRATLASGFIRVLGCSTNQNPTPSASPTASDPAASNTPSPTSGVKALATTTPSTGAGGGWLTLGAGLLVGGSGMVVVGALRRRETEDI